MTPASAAVSVVGAVVQNSAQEALTPDQFAKVDPVRAAATGALLGGVGAAVGEAAKGSVVALADAKYNRLTLPQKLLLNSNTIIPDPKFRSKFDRMYAFGGLASTMLSNAGPAIPATVTDTLPASSGGR
jgi:hypothetical protein